MLEMLVWQIDRENALRDLRESTFVTYDGMILSDIRATTDSG